MRDTRRLSSVVAAWCAACALLTACAGGDGASPQMPLQAAAGQNRLGAQSASSKSGGLLFVADSSGVRVYAAPYTETTPGQPVTPITTISYAAPETPGGIAVDKSGNLFVWTQLDGNLHDSIKEYAPPYTGLPIATSSTAGLPITTTFSDSMAVNAAGDIFVVGGSACPGCGYPLQEFAPLPSGSAIPIGVIFYGTPVGIATWH